jgi:hypothetical protein
MVKRAAAGAEGYVLDHFSRASIDAHIANVATPLVNAFGSQPPYSVFSDSLEVYESDWTTNFPAEFEKRRGYDLIPHLPELLAGGTPIGARPSPISSAKIISLLLPGLPRRIIPSSGRRPTASRR